MKQMIFLLLLMASMTAMGQESIPQDTTVYFNGRKLTIHEKNGKIKVKMYEANATNDTIENPQIFEGVYLGGRSIEQTTIVSSPFIKKNPFAPNKNKRYRFDPHYAAFYFGFGKLSNNSLQYSTSIPQINSKSWEWGINLFYGGIAITPNNHWGITGSFGFARSVYTLDDNYGFEKVGGITVCQPASDGINYSKSWLRYWSFRIPVSLEWQTRFGSNRTFISAGPEFEWRTGITSRAKYDGSKHTLSNDLNTHPLGLNLLMQAGYGCLGFTARFALTSLFEKNEGPNVYPTSIGIGLYW
ncbi:MAG: hypothetical protein LKI39_06420 [Bacteroides sp.]|jgi:hypothetical protein|nr:hypothetical protein [Bacteroides sp.]MCI1682176.1 hypothetical protein [Bacteroides sp.]